jgi:hypothetical protein
VSVSGTRSDGTQYSGSANVNVAAPAAGVKPTNGTDIWLSQNGIQVGPVCGKQTLADSCMELTPTVGSAGGTSGTTEWSQVINYISVSATDADGKAHSCSLPGPPRPRYVKPLHVCLTFHRQPLASIRCPGIRQLYREREFLHGADVEAQRRYCNLGASFIYKLGMGGDGVVQLRL